MDADREAFANFIARNGGPVSFEQFMREALYAPQQGYYTHYVAGVGRDADFSTSATLSNVHGDAIANWLIAKRAEIFGVEPCTVIELGPGNGALMRSVSTALAKAGARDNFTFSAVETSPFFRKAIADSLPKTCIQIFDTLAQALTAADGRALIYSNEFPDAFPAVQLQWRNDDWHEVFLDWDNAKADAVEVLRPLSRGIDADAPTRTREGQRLFIQPSYHDYLAENLPALKHGAMLTIDYGQAYPSAECRAYQNHEGYEGTDIYASMGQRDITCDVNFADLRRWGEQLGLQTTSLCPQADFLAAQLPDLEARKANDEAIAFLTNPLGAGGAFMVLEQQMLGGHVFALDEE